VPFSSKGKNPGTGLRLMSIIALSMTIGSVGWAFGKKDGSRAQNERFCECSSSYCWLDNSHRCDVLIEGAVFSLSVIVRMDKEKRSFVRCQRTQSVPDNILMWGGGIDAPPKALARFMTEHAARHLQSFTREQYCSLHQSFQKSMSRFSSLSWKCTRPLVRKDAFLSTFSLSLFLLASQIAEPGS
jgi:hypothetical protein